MLLEKLKVDLNCFEFNIYERVKEVNISFSCPKSTFTTINNVISVLLKFPHRDKTTLILYNGADDSIAFECSNLPTEQLWADFLDNSEEDSHFIAKLNIKKELKDGVFSIYSYKDFALDLNALSVLDFMKAMSTIIAEDANGVTFDMLDEAPMFFTSTFKFIPHSQIASIMQFQDTRYKCISDAKSNVFFLNFNNIHLSPLDFTFELNYPNNPLTERFNTLATLLSLAYISNSSTITESELNIQIIGQRTFTEHIRLSTIVFNQHIIDICNWIYFQNFSTDKLMIARNMISLHCKNMSLQLLDDRTLSSIHSNYNLYLKENVDRYLDLKNELSSFLYDLVSKTGEYSMQILSKLKANLFTMIAFILTVFISNATSSQPLNNIFTKDITAISEIIILGSFVFMLLSIFEHNNNMKNIEKSYELLKKNYNDLLSPDDLNKIFENDSIKNDAMNLVNRFKKIYVGLWIVFLLICVFCVENLSSDPIIITFFNNIKYWLSEYIN